jgi:hypothetical protein
MEIKAWTIGREKSARLLVLDSDQSGRQACAGQTRIGKEGPQSFCGLSGGRDLTVTP